MEDWKYGLFERAVAFAVMMHSGQMRKGKEKPYILHPLEVAAIAGACTDDPEVLAAAVLHDTVEDTPATKEMIEALFGKRVAELVASESEDKMEDQPAESTWKIRKQRTIDHLAGMSREAKLICLGDKLANIREMAADYKYEGDGLWARFNQKDPRLHGWYYKEVMDVLKEAFPDSPAIQEYEQLWNSIFLNDSDRTGGRI